MLELLSTLTTHQFLRQEISCLKHFSRATHLVALLQAGETYIVSFDDSVVATVACEIAAKLVYDYFCSIAVKSGELTPNYDTTPVKALV